MTKLPHGNLRRLARAVVPALALASLGGAPVGAKAIELVVCAPGYPGNTEQAQPTMDAFASGVAGASGWTAGSLRASYHETLEGGLERLKQEETAIALVPLPFFLEYREEFGLSPLVEATPQSGEAERWSLVAGKGTLTDKASLAGWEITGLPGYSPRFVRRLALEGVEAPGSTAPEITFTPRILSALRRAARGERVAALLDQAQTDALEALPFAADLEIVHRSSTMPYSLVCSVGQRLTAKASAELKRGLLALHEGAEGAALLESLRLSAFGPLPEERLAQLGRTFDASKN